LAEDDAKNGTTVITIPPAAASKEDILEAVVKNIHAQMDIDRKTTALKALQGCIWKSGYENGQLKGEYAYQVETLN